MALFKVKHITQYSYTEPVIDSMNQLMLYPLQEGGQELISHQLTVSGYPEVETFTDYFGNKVGIFSLLTPHEKLTILSEIEIETSEPAPPADLEPAGVQWDALSTLQEQFPYLDYLQQEDFEALEELSRLNESMLNKAESPLTNALRLSAYIYHHFQYRKGITSIETGIDEIWQLKAGVCQDFAHMLMVLLRMTGIPARYVSGYICPKNHELRGEGATHAWVEAYIPFFGWLGLDPTNNCIVTDRHIRLAVGRHFTDCTPVKGTYKGSAAHTLEVSVVISNGENGNQLPPGDETPVFSYKVENPSPENNSYRKYMEMQQQQQQ